MSSSKKVESVKKSDSLKNKKTETLFLTFILKILPILINESSDEFDGFCPVLFSKCEHF